MKPRFCTVGFEVLCSTVELTETFVVGVAVCDVFAILSIIAVVVAVAVAAFIVVAVVCVCVCVCVFVCVCLFPSTVKASPD